MTGAVSRKAKIAGEQGERKVVQGPGPYCADERTWFERKERKIFLRVSQLLSFFDVPSDRLRSLRVFLAISVRNFREIFWFSCQTESPLTSLLLFSCHCPMLNGLLKYFWSNLILVLLNFGACFITGFSTILSVTNS